jgi:hypothetical protein
MTTPETPATEKSLFCGLLKAFTAHPAQANETYLEHLAFTLRMAARLFFCAAALLVHGIFPFLCTHTASTKMKKCQSILSDRAAMTQK